MSIIQLKFTKDLDADLAAFLDAHAATALACPPSLPHSVATLFRVTSVPRAVVKSGSPRGSLQKAITALWNLKLPFVFALLAYKGELEVLIGAGNPVESGVTMQDLVRGCLPGVYMDKVPTARMVAAMADWPYVVSAWGTPTPGPAPLDILVRGLPDHGWIYLVLAKPVALGQIEAALARLTEEEKWLTYTWLRPGTLEAAANPTASQLKRLVEEAIRQCKSGLLLGMWHSWVLFAAETPAITRVGTGLLASAFAGRRSLPHPFRVLSCDPLDNAASHSEVRFTDLPTSLLSQLAHLPSIEAPGYRVTRDRSFSESLPPTPTPSLSLGRLVTLGGSRGNKVEIEVGDLIRHAFITGITGSGKTCTCQSLLVQLWRRHRIPFWVIEPAKREHRSLKRISGMEKTLVFTLGDEREAPFRMNILQVPPGVPVQTHIDLLRTLFQATFAGLYPPLPYLLEQALIESYESLGWDLATDAGGCGHPCPRLEDLYRHACLVAERAGYDPEVTQNVRTALKVRLGSLLIGAKGRLLNVQSSFPFDDLIGRPVVFEMATIGDPDLVSLLIGALLIRLYEHRLFHPGTQTNSGLVHVTVLEEAHRLLSNRAAPSHPDVSAIQHLAVETFCNLLTEIRAFGEGIIVIDQSPAKLHPDVLRGTDLKIVHRLLAEDDRRAVGGCMGMTHAQMEALSSLSIGEAVVFNYAFASPTLVQIVPVGPTPAWVSGHIQDTEGRVDTGVPAMKQVRMPNSTVRSEGVDSSPLDPDLVKAFQALLAAAEPATLWDQLARFVLAQATADPQKQARELANFLVNSLAVDDSTRETILVNLEAALAREGGELAP